jgi:hypothetical protein
MAVPFLLVLSVENVASHALFRRPRYRQGQIEKLLFP